MKSRATLKRERDAVIKARDECWEDRVAVHERLATAERERESARALAKMDRLARENAERDRAQALIDRDGLREQAERDRAGLIETIEQRDSWAARAHEMTVAQDEALEFAQVAVTERNQAWADRDEAVRECGSAQEDARVLAERLQQAEDALIVLARERVLQPTVELQDGRIVPLKSCSLMGEHVGHAWWPRADKAPEGQQMHWCDGRAADGSAPYRFQEERARRVEYERDVWSSMVHDDHPGPAGAERLRADEFGGGAPRVLIEHWQGVAKRLEERHGVLAADNVMLVERANEATTRADRLERERDEQREAHEQWRSDCLVARDGYSELHSRLSTMMEERDNLLVENEALNREREDALAALQQVKAERDELRPLEALRDPVVAQDRIVKATERMNRAEAEFENLRTERDDLRESLRTADARWTDVVKGVRREVGEMQRERDAWSERAETHEQERDQALAQRDEWRGLAERAQAERDEARGWLSRVNEVLGDHRTQAAFVDDAVEEVVRKLHAAIQRENDAVPALGTLTRERVDGALENALVKLSAALGADVMESPAEMIEMGLDALKDARREAGRLKLVLDIIDERKATAPIFVERRAVGGPQQDAHGN